MSGSYELRDLDHPTVGQLYEGKVVIDKTYGHASYGCGTCCGYQTPTLNPNPFSGPPGIDNNDVINTIEQCGGSLDDVTDAGYSWKSSNTAIFTLPTRTLHTVAPGSATGSALIQLEWTHPAPQCPSPVFNPTQPGNVNPVISGPSTVWWFKGQNPNSTNYPVSITLTANCGSSGCPATPQWSVTQADAKIKLSSTSGTQITVTSTGTYFSKSVGDISITTSVNGIASSAYKITNRTPWKLVASKNSGTSCYSGFGYLTDLFYLLVDQLSTTIGDNVDWNEDVGAPQSQNGSNWGNYALKTSGGSMIVPPGGSAAELLDELSGPGTGNNPPPSPMPTCNTPPSGGTAYDLATQNIQVGSSTSGQGVFAQQDNLTYYTDHGSHTSIIIPPAPPE